jgi:hypothetical protein
MKNRGLNREHWITWIIFKYRLPPLCIRKYPIKLKKPRAFVAKNWVRCVADCNVKSLHPYGLIFCFCFFTLRYKVHNTVFRRFSPNCQKRLLVSSCLSVCLLAWNNSAPTGRNFFCDFLCWRILKICKENCIEIWEEWRVNQVLGTFIVISRRILIKMRNVSDKSCIEYQNTHFMLKFFSRNLALYEIMWKNAVKPNRPQITITDNS